MKSVQSVQSDLLMLFSNCTRKLLHHSLFSFGSCLKMSTHPPFLQVLAASVTAVNKAGDLVRDIMATGKLDIVEKENATDLQVSHSQNIYF